MELVAGRRPTRSIGADPARRWMGSSVDFGAVADGLSLLMPHLEPLAIIAVRESLQELRSCSDPANPQRDPSFSGESDLARLTGSVEVWVSQEAAHQAEHRHHNEGLRQTTRGLAPLDRAIAKVTRFIARRGLGRRLAFTCGFEAVAYSVARWVEPRMGELFCGAEPETASLFLWHLAEEVEHKSVVHDLHLAVGGGSLARLFGGVAALAVIGPFTIAAALVCLWNRRRLRHPSTWWHLVRWSVSFAFSALTAVGMLALPGHSPNDLADPLWYRQYLRGADADTAVLPPWEPLRGPTDAERAV